MKDILKTIIKDFHKRRLPEFIEREIDIPLNSKKIVTIVGPRRAGKTYLMYQLISKISDITNVIYINFEDERLELKSKDMGLIIETFFELYPDKKEKELYFFFDEIQEIESWEKFVRRVYDTITTNIFITGSSAKFLSKEIATTLRGRTITYDLFPLSFREYLKFKNVEEEIHSTKGKAKIISEFGHYTLTGGFPETIKMEKMVAEKTLQTYFEVMLYRDIAERHGLTNLIPLKEFVKNLLSNISKEFSVNKIFNNLKSKGISVSKNSLYDYLDYCSDAFVLSPISNFSESANKQIGKKSYSIDVGLSLVLSFSLSRDKGRILENIILLELKRRNLDVYYYRNSNECDFIIKKKNKIISAIQVCFELKDENKEREINGLKEAMKRFNLKKGLIVTNAQEGNKNKDIKVVTAWRWLLDYEA